MLKVVRKYQTRKALRWADRYTLPALSVTIAPYTMPKGR